MAGGMKSLIKGSYDNDPRGKNSYKIKRKKKSNRKMSNEIGHLSKAGTRSKGYVKP